MSEKKRILVVEDDAALLPMISYNLQKNGRGRGEAQGWRRSETYSRRKC